MVRLTVDDIHLAYEVPGRGLGGMIGDRVRRRSSAVRPRRIHALRGVSLSMVAGDRLALLGLNGAGKTTLLKVMAGIYEPASGQVTAEGAIAPLFDVGLGMDADLTGRQNLVARGLFLGLTRSQVAGMEEEIVEFTGLAEHIDLPVSTYSAGMYIRLAFAIVTSLTPEILLMDEGIGAGDAEFRERAQARVSTFMRRAGILVLASHDYGLVREYCDQALVLHDGLPVFHGPVEGGIAHLENLVSERREPPTPRDSE